MWLCGSNVTPHGDRIVPREAPKGFMKTPAALQPLIDDGVIDEVLRSLKSGKEATVLSGYCLSNTVSCDNCTPLALVITKFNVSV